MTVKPGRLRTAIDPAKAFRQYDELRRGKRLKTALIIAETTDGQFQLLGQMTDAVGCARLLVVAADALSQVPPEQRGDPPPPRPAPRPIRTTSAEAPRLHTIAAAWSSFEQSVLPDTASAIQRQETRRSFYAGAATLLETITTMLEPGDEMTEADLHKMTELDAELRRFATDLGEGRA